MVAAVAGDTPVGADLQPKDRERLRGLGAVATPADLHIDASTATRGLLAAQSIADLVDWSRGLYEPR
jgi:malonate decarboxylase alpha subunit